MVSARIKVLIIAPELIPPKITSNFIINGSSSSCSGHIFLIQLVTLAGTTKIEVSPREDPYSKRSVKVLVLKNLPGPIGVVGSSLGVGSGQGISN